MTQKTGFLFPGQGAQFVGMGKDLYESSPEARAIYDQADTILGYSIKQICFEGPEEKLTQTIYAQPAIFVSSVAALKLLQTSYPHLVPDFCAGLSLGEFSALTACHAISFEHGLRLVKKRAEAMEISGKNNQGTMASIMGLDEAACSQIAQEAGCEVANRNAPDQFVLSGTFESIDKACAIADAKGAKRALKLKVSGAFHSSLMQEAKASLEKALAETEIKTPSCVFVPNVLGIPEMNPEKIRRLLAEQLMSSVQWIKTMQTAASQSMEIFLEIGPGKVLKGLARKCDRNINVESAGSSVEIKNLVSLFQNV